MKKVTWVDRDGKKRAALVRDEDDESVAIEGHGIPLDPPDVSVLDWNEVARDLHNSLVDRGLISKEDVIRSKAGVNGAVLAALRRKVLALYGIGG